MQRLHPQPGCATDRGEVMSINLTLIGQSITFFVFVWFCWKFIWPPLVAAMKARGLRTMS